jgi:hypothetical protein
MSSGVDFQSAAGVINSGDDDGGLTAQACPLRVKIHPTDYQVKQSDPEVLK